MWLQPVGNCGRRQAAKHRGVKPMIGIIDMALRAVLVLIALVDLFFRIFKRKKN